MVVGRSEFFWYLSVSETFGGKILLSKKISRADSVTEVNYKRKGLRYSLQSNPM